MRTKTFTAASWPGMFKEQHGKFARVWMPDDRVAIKEASTSVFSKRDLEELRPPKGYFGIHRTIMGSEEGYGFNINGDSYPEEMLQRDHPTFVTHGHVFVEHDNRDPKKSIGKIKAARFNPKSQRVETVEHVDIKKGERFYEDARRGKELHASQACKIPYDECSICGNKAAKARDYCSDIRQYLKQMVPGRNKYAFMRNNHCTFFDSSIVEVPADVTAKPHRYWFNTEDSVKAASAIAPLIDDWNTKAAGARVLPISAEEAQVLRVCAEMEDMSRPDKFRDVVAAHACQPMKVAHATLQELRKLQPGTLWCKMASKRILLPFDVFSSYLLDMPVDSVRAMPEFTKAASVLPGIFRALASALENQEECECHHDDIAVMRPFDPITAACDPENNDAVDRIMHDMAEEAGFDDEPVRHRTVRIMIIKSASAHADRADFKVPQPKEVSRLATVYACYKLAAIAAMKLPPHELHKMAAYAVMQN